MLSGVDTNRIAAALDVSPTPLIKFLTGENHQRIPIDRARSFKEDGNYA